METKSKSFLMEERAGIPADGEICSPLYHLTFSLILSAVYLIFSSRIISMFGGTVNEETFRHSKEYFFWITLGIPFYMFGQEQYAQIPMAVVGIVMKFFQIVISIVVGMAAGCIPIVGYNIGAGAAERVKELFTKLLAAETLVGILAGHLGFTFA